MTICLKSEKLPFIKVAFRLVQQVVSGVTMLSSSLFKGSINMQYF